MTKLNKKQNKISKLAIFSGSLLAAASAVMLFAPVIKSNAAEKTLNVTAIIDPVISLSLDKSALDFNITPTSAGVFDSGSIVATVDTNSTGGYELYFSSEDSSTSMTSLVSESTIASDFSSTVTSSTMAANKWGYSTDATNFSSVPTLANHAKIKDISLTPTAAEKVTTITIGTKIDSSLPSGAYSKNVVITAVAHPSRTPTLSDLTTMQQMTSETCLETAVDENGTLTDTRTGNTYTVAKLADNRCWMTQDLVIEDALLTPADSDVSEDFSLPSASTATFNDASSARVRLDETSGSSAWYNWYAATAGSGTYNTTGAFNPVSQSICPKGWKLPSSIEYGDGLQDVYNNSAENGLDRYTPNFSRRGTVYQARIDDYGTKAYYWLANPGTSAGSAMFMMLDNDNVYQMGVGNSVYFGRAVRCIAR
jgi:uncharacterized protein (TIGR02145 family)